MAFVMKVTREVFLKERVTKTCLYFTRDLYHGSTNTDLCPFGIPTAAFALEGSQAGSSSSAAPAVCAKRGATIIPLGPGQTSN